MSRASSISYEEAAEIATSLVLTGIEEPSAAHILKVLQERRKDGEKGSLTTIHKHLKVWRKANPESAIAPIELPQPLLAEIGRALTAVETSTRQHSEDVRVRIEAELDALVESGEIQETQIRYLKEDLAFKTSQCDSMEGKLSLKIAEVEELKNCLAVSRANEAAFNTRVQVADLELRMERARSAELSALKDREIARLSAELGMRQRELSAATERCVQSEKQLAASDALLDVSNEARSVLTLHINDLREQCRSSCAVQGTMQTEIAEQQSAITRLGAEVSRVVTAAAIERAELLAKLLAIGAAGINAKAAEMSSVGAGADAMKLNGAADYGSPMAESTPSAVRVGTQMQVIAGSG